MATIAAVRHGTEGGKRRTREGRARRASTSRLMLQQYDIYGLSVASQIDLPEMWPIAPEDARQPDVEIRRGQAPLELEETSERTGEYVVTDTGILLDLPEIGRFWAVGGHTLIATPAPDADTNLIRLFLLGSGLAAILHQRGEFPLHASAIEHDGKCSAFLGDSGSGKSTLVGMLAQRAFPIVSDDVLVLSTPQPEAGAVMTVPGIPVLKLWPESARASGFEDAGAPCEAYKVRKHRIAATPSPAGGETLWPPLERNRTRAPKHQANRQLRCNQTGPHQRLSQLPDPYDGARNRVCPLRGHACALGRII